MADKKNFFHKVLDAMIETRAMQAEREVAAMRNKYARSYREIF